MNKFKRSKNKSYIFNLSTVATMSGLAMFLSGCDGSTIDDDCKKNINMQPQSKIEECKKKNTVIGSGGSHSSGFFSNTSSVYSAAS